MNALRRLWATLRRPSSYSMLTLLVSVYAIMCGYEWTHYLVHSDYRPRSAWYRSVWRNHRLHHYKNEHYWFTVTSSGTADRLLGTYPASATVATPYSPRGRPVAGSCAWVDVSAERQAPAKSDRCHTVGESSWLTTPPPRRRGPVT